MLGLNEPSALVYICILVTSTTTGHDGSVVSALASQAGSIPSYGTSFFSHGIHKDPSIGAQTKGCLGYSNGCHGSCWNSKLA